MNVKELKQLEDIINHAVDNKFDSLNNKNVGTGRILQGIIIAGIIGLFVQFNEVKDATTISKAERETFKEDIKELKIEIRSLRTTLYNIRRSEITDKKTTTNGF